LDIEKELSSLDSNMGKKIAVAQNDLISNFGSLMVYYNTLYKGDFLGFSIWKNAVFSSLRTRREIEYRRD
jgi:hypothetical protein|tara:strand:- start:229 stop:438 length:210 start_codon:yes stop_codon:yes gene_type:complete